MIKQTVLPFKLEKTMDMITAHAGLALVGRICGGTWVEQSVGQRICQVLAVERATWRVNMYFRLY